jgi:thioredoxin reductase (NADPH)
MRPLKNLCELAVIGAGVAGLAAARHAARLGCLVTLFEGSGLFGGLVATREEVDGLLMPGKYSGQALAIHLLEEARRAAVRVVDTSISRMDLGERLTLTDEQHRSYYPEVVVIASGASLRKLGVPQEDEFLGRGVSRCATCDGGFFRGQDVVVVGGGDGAVQEALVLAKTSRRVVMICRRPLKAKRDYIEKIAARENVSFVWDSEITAILGDDGVSGVSVRNLKSGASSDIECTGLFPFIGVTPNTGFVPAALLAASGYVNTGSIFATADPRVFAVGAVRGGYGGNVIQAMAEGVGAADSAARLLFN